MVLEQLLRDYGINAMKLFAVSGFSSTGNIAFYKQRDYLNQHPLLQRNIRLLASNLALVVAMEDYDDEFVSLMKKSCICITKENVYLKYTLKGKTTYYNRLIADDDFARMVATDIHTGLLLFIGGYEQMTSGVPD